MSNANAFKPDTVLPDEVPVVGARAEARIDWPLWKRRGSRSVFQGFVETHIACIQFRCVCDPCSAETFKADALLVETTVNVGESERLWVRTPDPHKSTHPREYEVFLWLCPGCAMLHWAVREGYDARQWIEEAQPLVYVSKEQVPCVVAANAEAFAYCRASIVSEAAVAAMVPAVPPDKRVPGLPLPLEYAPRPYNRVEVVQECAPIPDGLVEVRTTVRMSRKVQEAGEVLPPEGEALAEKKAMRDAGTQD